MRVLRSLGLVALAILGSAAPAAAQGNIQLGPFRILPSLGLTGTYDDNILLTPRDEIDDFIWTISPGVVVELPARRYSIRVGYLADILLYTENDALDTVHHTAQGEGRYNFPWGLGIRLTDKFLITDEFAGFPVPELVQRVDRHENTLETGADYTLSERFQLDVNFKWFLVDYEKDFDDLDRQDYTIAGTVFYRVFSKTSVLGEVDYNWIRYTEADQDVRDSNSWRFKLGVKGDITAKTSVLIKAGWEFKDYIRDGIEDWDGLIVEADVVWKYREPSEVRIFGGRANTESLFAENNYYISTYGGIEVRHFLSERLIFRVRGLAGVNDYPETVTVGSKTDERRDTFYEVGAALKYQIRRWIAVELGYERLTLDSNFSDFDYTANRVRGTILLTY